MRQRPGNLAHIIASQGVPRLPMRGEIDDGVMKARAPILIMIDGIENIGE